MRRAYEILGIKSIIFVIIFPIYSARTINAHKMLTEEMLTRQLLTGQ